MDFEYEITRQSVKDTLQEYGMACPNAYCLSTDISVNTTLGTISDTAKEDYECRVCKTAWRAVLTPVTLDWVGFPNGGTPDRDAMYQAVENLEPPILKGLVREFLEVMKKPSLEDRAEILARLMQAIAPRQTSLPNPPDTARVVDAAPPF